MLSELQQAWTTHRSTLMTHPAAGFGMWPNVQKNLESANVSFQAVKNKLIPVLESVGKRSGFLGINAGAWKLGMRISALAVYQERLRAHHTAFRIGAIMIRLYVPLGLPPCHVHALLTRSGGILDASAPQTGSHPFSRSTRIFRVWLLPRKESRRNLLWGLTRRMKGSSWMLPWSI